MALLSFPNLASSRLSLLLILECFFLLIEPASPTQIGFTHTQYSLDPWGNSASIARAMELLRSGQVSYQNQHIMGWGGGNPEPSPGEYDWSSLDRRVSQMVETGASPVITLCCAPDWMKGGEPGFTNWSRLEVAPLPQHYLDFANLAGKVAERYPEVKHYQVWNEQKGFWNREEDRWAYENYTELYNMVYKEVKRVRPEARVGGPYVTTGFKKVPSPDLMGPWGTVDQRQLDSIEYWLQHNIGADFVCVDGGVGENWEEDWLFGGVLKFREVTQWLKVRTDLPVWWSEWYPLPEKTEHYPEEKLLQMFAQAIPMIDEAEVVLMWPGQGVAGQWTRSTLWNDTREAEGGFPTSFWQVVAEVNEGDLP